MFGCMVDITMSIKEIISPLLTVLNIQIFGSRIFPITKISDLLTGQGPPFDIALANHLYAPASVYNTKLQKLATADEALSTSPATFHFPHFKPEKPKSQGGPYYVEEYSTKKTLSHKPSFHLPGILGSEFYTQKSKYHELRPKPLTSTPEPQLYIYKEQLNFGPFIPIAYNQPQSAIKIKPEELGFDYENQDGSQEEKEQGLDKVATTYRPEKSKNPYLQAKGYHAHPDGGISYSRFIHDQAVLDPQTDSKILYHTSTKTEQQPFEPEFGQKENINVPQPPSSNPIHNIATQQNVPVSQSQQQFHQTLMKLAPFKSGFNILSEPKFPILQSPRHPVYYLHPIKKPHNQLQPNPALPSLEHQQPPLKALPNIAATLETLDRVINNSATRDTTVPSSSQLLQASQTRFTPQPNSQISFPVLRNYTPSSDTVTHYQSVVPLSTSPATPQPQGDNTPKSSQFVDQVLQPTTTQPETISDAPRDIESELKQYSQETISLTSPTLQPFLVSPVTSQSLSSIQPKHSISSTPRTEISKSAKQAHSQSTPHHQVQIQQQNLHEIHLELAPAIQDNSQHLPNNLEQKYQSLSTTPEFQPTTPQSTDKSIPDYEIEIASHIDHNQLPKDLQPLTTVQATSNLGESRVPHFQQAYSPNNTFALARHLYLVPIQSFGEPPSYQNINYHDPNSLFLGQPLATIKPFLQPRALSNIQEFVLQPHFQQTSSFPAVQYFGKYAQSIFGNL